MIPISDSAADTQNRPLEAQGLRRATLNNTIVPEILPTKLRPTRPIYISQTRKMEILNNEGVMEMTPSIRTLRRIVLFFLFFGWKNRIFVRGPKYIVENKVATIVQNEKDKTGMLRDVDKYRQVSGDKKPLQENVFPGRDDYFVLEE